MHNSAEEYKHCELIWPGKKNSGSNSCSSYEEEISAG